MLGVHTARDRPKVDAHVVSIISASRPLTGERTAMPVIGRATDKQGRPWLRVRLPGRALQGGSPPQTGWIRAANTLLSSTGWHIVVHLSLLSVIVYHNGRRQHDYLAIVGKPSTPTPRGEYFVEENVTLNGGQPGGPFALATSDRSNVLQQFDGGPGQIALHGLDNLGGTLGTAVSHGCIRMADSAISWLAARIRPGTPVSII